MKNKIVALLILSAFMLSTWLNAQDTLTIHNETKENAYAAFYYNKDAPERISKPTEIKTQTTYKTERPEKKPFFDREMAVSRNQEDLKKNLTDKEFGNLTRQNVGTIRGSYFYIITDGDKLKVLNEAQWKIEKPAKETLEKKLIQPIKDKIVKEFLTHPYSNRTASVRVGTGLSPDEQTFLAARRPRVRAALSKLLNMDLNDQQTPTIAILFSGGGYRAMLASLGFALGAQDTGLINATMYIATLSGSTWFLAPWTVARAQNGMSLEQYQQKLLSVVSTGLEQPMLSMKDQKDIAYLLIGKKLSGQPITIIDLWGAVLARKLFFWSNNRQNVNFYSARNLMISGAIPMPICTTVSNNISPDSTYRWFEVRPDEAGSVFLNAWIPTWAVGRKFNNGTSTDFGPPASLGLLEGIFGAAFAISAGDIMDHVVPEDILAQLLKPINQQFKRELKDVRSKRIVPGGRIHNFVEGLNQAPGSARMKEVIELVDGGMGGNLPYVPLGRKERKKDIIIICDMSESTEGAPELRKAQRTAAQHNLPFPDIDWKKAGHESISVFGNPEKPDTPVIIYLPKIRNEKLPEPYNNVDIEKESGVGGFANTMKFSYSHKNASLLVGWARESMKAAQPVILDVARKRAVARGGKEKKSPVKDAAQKAKSGQIKLPPKPTLVRKKVPAVA